MPLSNASGQALLIGVCLVLVLLIGATIVIFVNQVGTIHQTASAQRLNTRSVAQEGITHAIQQLSVDSTTWTRALNNDFTGTDCFGSPIVASPSGGRFKLICSTDAAKYPDLQTYQVAVTAVALAPGGSGADVPLRAVQAYLSVRTLGIDLGTGLHAAAALQLVRQPVVQAGGKLNVHWGPVVCLDSADWDIHGLDPFDGQRYPRKFSQGGITGTFISATGPAASTLSTDQAEYWAYAPQIAPPVIDSVTYVNNALSETTITQLPKVGGTNRSCTGAGNCGYFKLNIAAGETAVFGSGAPYTVPAGNPVIFVDGDAEFDKVAIDSATFIITGDLTVTDPPGGSTLPDLHIPATAPSEYPYNPKDPTGFPKNWPCWGNWRKDGSGTCDSTSDPNLFPPPGKVQFRGFLYVKGDFKVNANNWNMAGALMVGDPFAAPTANGTLKISGTNTLNLAYDDQINHDIHVYPISQPGAIRIVPDVIRDVPVP